MCSTNESSPRTRSYLDVVFHTAPLLAQLSSSLAAAWPEAAKDRETHPPFELEADSGDYLVDPTHTPSDQEDLPSIGEFLDDQFGYLTATRSEQDEIIIEFLGLSPEDEDATPEELERFRSTIGEEVELDWIDPHVLTAMSPYGPAIEILDALDGEQYQDLDIWLVEGDRPGSDFIGVRFPGNVDLLNLQLAQHGLNMIVRRAES